jgi:hypothetical protein
MSADFSQQRMDKKTTLTPVEATRKSCTSLGNVDIDLLFEKIGARVFVHGPLKRVTTQQRLVTVRSWDSRDTVLLQEIIHFRKRLSVYAKHAVPVFTADIDLTREFFPKENDFEPV